MNWLEGVERAPSPNRGAALKNPTAITMHYTAGRGFAQSLAWLCNPAAKASAHLLYGRGGERAQLVPLDVQAWHAGPSSWGGRAKCNRFMLGIEIDNYGKLVDFEGRPYPWFAVRKNKHTGRRELVPGSKPVPPAELLRRADGTVWHAYTETQLVALEGDVRTILLELPSITEIVGHSDVAPRKLDPGPAFPMARFRALLKRPAR